MRTIRVSAIPLLIAAATILAQSSPGWAYAGQPVNVITTPSSMNIAADGVVVNPADGSIYVEGQENAPAGGLTNANFITVTHILSGGSFDGGYGSGLPMCSATQAPPCTDGTSTGTVRVSQGLTYSGAAIALDHNGDVLAAGGIRKPNNGPFSMGVVRVLPNGQPDQSFGSHGVAVIDNCSDNGQASAASVTEGPSPNYSIVLVGTATCIADESDQLAVAELTSAGQPASFGTNGWTLSSSSSLIKGYDGAVDAAGNVTAAGYEEGCGGVDCFYVERLSSAGAFDRTFGTLGSATYSPDGSTQATAYNVALVGTEIVVAGACVLTQNNMSNWYICADKLSADGKTLDPNFGTAGTLAIADGNVGAQTMAVQANGEFVFGSVCPKSSNPCGLVARATSSGQADTCFGSQTTNPCTGTGIVTFTSPPCKGAINGVAVDDTRGLIYASGADEISTMCAGVQPTYAILVGTLDE